MKCEDDVYESSSYVIVTNKRMWGIRLISKGHWSYPPWHGTSVSCPNYCAQQPFLRHFHQYFPIFFRSFPCYSSRLPLPKISECPSWWKAKVYTPWCPWSSLPLDHPGYPTPVPCCLSARPDSLVWVVMYRSVHKKNQSNVYFQAQYSECICISWWHWLGNMFEFTLLYY